MQLDLCLSCRFGQLVVCQCFVLDRHGLRREAGLAFRRPSIVCKSSGSCLVISYVVSCDRTQSSNRFRFLLCSDTSERSSVTGLCQGSCVKSSDKCQVSSVSSVSSARQRLSGLRTPPAAPCQLSRLVSRQYVYSFESLFPYML